MIYLLAYCAFAYGVGGYIVHRHPYKEDDSVYEGSSSDPTHPGNQCMSGGIFLLSPLWVELFVLVGLIWLVGKLATAGIK